MFSSQPKGLYNLCFTEMWERFGYYMVQTIFILFLTQSMHYPQKQSDLLFGAFAGLLYVTPVIGGWLADNFLGFRRAIIFGAILLFIGYAVLMFHGMQTFRLGLAILITGNGFLKPNISSIVGDLYGDDEAKREGGFTLFYMGINLGSIIPPIIAGSVVGAWGWHYGFGLAAVGMILCLLNFSLGGRSIRSIGVVPKGSPLQKGGMHALRFNILLYLGTAVGIGLFYEGVTYAASTNWVIIGAGVVFSLFVLYHLLKEDVSCRYKMVAALILILLSIGFWALYSESFTALTLFAAHNMDLHLLSFKITPEFTQFYNGFFIIALSPLFNAFWLYLDRYNLNPSIPLKFALGIGFMCLGYVFLTWATNGQFGHNGILSSWWLIGSYFLQTVGELCLSPIGLAMITVLAPKHLVGLMMGMWFFALAGASSLSGMLAGLAAMPEHQSTISALAIYHHAFGMWSWMSAILVAISFVCYPLLKRMIAGPRLQR
ncbi:MAG: MFS transporter [Mariprofundaceae bacterium]|nr:MFS transporter [Mariprofundaceae bacterium]